MELLRNIVASLKRRIAQDIRTETDGETFNMVIRAYKEFQKYERMGVDYIFNIENKDDVIECLNCGLTTKDIAKLYNESQVNTTKYFFYHTSNHPTPEPITWENLRQLMIDELDSILYAVIAYPWVESYREIYTKYVCDPIIDNLFIN